MAEDSPTHEDAFWQELRDSKKPAVPTAALAQAIEAPTSDEYKTIRKELWQGAGWFTVWAIVNFLSGNNSFAIALLVLALLTYLLPSVALFAIHGLFFLWAATVNLLSPAGEGAYFWAIVLIVSAVVELRRFFRHRPLEQANLGGGETAFGQSERASRLWPWLAAAFGSAGLIGWLAMWLSLFTWGALNGPSAGEPPAIILTPLWLSADIGVMGLSMGITALIMRYPYKLASAVGVATGGLLMAIFLVVSLLF